MRYKFLVELRQRQSVYGMPLVVTVSSHGLELYSWTAKCCEAYMPIGHDHISVSAPYPHLSQLLSEERYRVRAQQIADAENREYSQRNIL